VPDVGAGAFAKRRIVLDDVIALSVFPFLCFGWFILQCVVVSFFVECFLVWGGRAAWSKDALSDDRDDRRLLMLAGMFFVVIGGWLLSQ